MNIVNQGRSLIKTMKKKLSKDNNTIILILIGFSIFFCYLARLPKHGDFWGIIGSGKISENIYGPPLLGIIYGSWNKIGGLFLPINLETWNISMTSVGWVPSGISPKLTQYWGMIPLLLMLLFLVVLSFYISKNKWLPFIFFGTFSFISIIVMGQIDVWNVLWIYIAILLAVKAIESDNRLKFIVLSIFTLGLSMQVKPFGGLIFPVILFFFWGSLQNKRYTTIEQFCILLVLILEFIVVSFWGWFVWIQHLSPGIFIRESSWILNLQTAPVQLPPYHTISIWLLGYVVILYDMITRSKPANTFQLKKLFIFYIFATIIWFFISVYTNPQWWILLIPPILLVLDNFNYRFNYLFYACISVFFLFYTMQWTNIVYESLKFYMPIIPVTGSFSIVIVTIISALLLLWIYELRKETNENSEPVLHDNNMNTFISIPKIALIFPAVLVVFLFLVVLIMPPGILGISQPVANQPIGEITGGITAGQTFYSTLPNLNSIDIEFATYARANTKDILFHLRERPDSSIDIITMRVNAQQIPDNQYYKFKFEPIKNSVNKSYYFFLESPNSFPGNAITIWSSKDDVYSQGSL